MIVMLGSDAADGLQLLFFFSSRRRHTRLQGDWSSDVCSSDLGGESAVVPGANLPDAASYLNTAQPHPPLSANRLLSFTIKSTSCSVPGTVAAGDVSRLFGVQWVFALLEPSGDGLFPSSQPPPPRHALRRASGSAGRP